MREICKKLLLPEEMKEALEMAPVPGTICVKAVKDDIEMQMEGSGGSLAIEAAAVMAVTAIAVGHAQKAEVLETFKALMDLAIDILTESLAAKEE